MSSFKHKKLGWTCASLSTDFIPEIKDVILSRLDELLDLSYIDKKKKKLEMSSFQCNLNSSKISHVTLDMFKEYTMI
jgi:DNA-directed RNA polymerase